jgi:hypothetical protein
LFSLDIESMIVLTAMSQPLRERAVSGVNIQGKPGMRKVGKKKVSTAVTVNTPPKTTSNQRNHVGSGSSDVSLGEA